MNELSRKYIDDRVARCRDKDLAREIAEDNLAASGEIVKIEDVYYHDEPGVVMERRYYHSGQKRPSTISAMRGFITPLEKNPMVLQ